MEKLKITNILKRLALAIALFPLLECKDDRTSRAGYFDTGIAWIPDIQNSIVQQEKGFEKSNCVTIWTRGDGLVDPKKPCFGFTICRNELKDSAHSLKTMDSIYSEYKRSSDEFEILKASHFGAYTCSSLAFKRNKSQLIDAQEVITLHSINHKYNYLVKTYLGYGTNSPSNLVMREYQSRVNKIVLQ